MSKELIIFTIWDFDGCVYLKTEPHMVQDEKLYKPAIIKMFLFSPAF